MVLRSMPRYKILLNISGGGTVPLLHEPKGWRILQEMAHRETDPQKFAAIIDQLNRLLDEHEKMMADCEFARPSSQSGPRLRVN